MKRSKLLTLLLGFAILSGVVCSGIIIASGIKDNASASASSDGPRKEKSPQPHTLEKTKLDEFSEAAICLSYADLSILPSDGYYLEYRLDGTYTKPEYGVSDGKFYFEEGHAQKQFLISFGIGAHFTNPGPLYLNLYVPKDHYLKLLEVTMESGDVDAEQANAERAEFSIAYGDLDFGEFSGDDLIISSESGNINFEGITCKNLTVSDSYGNFTGDALSVSNRAEFSLESGNLDVSQLEAETLSFNGQYGDCEAGSISVKKGGFSLESGNLALENAALGNTSISSQYGDVRLMLSDQVSSYNYGLETEYGSISVDGTSIKENEDGQGLYQKQGSQKKKSIDIFCESGNIKIW